MISRLRTSLILRSLWPLMVGAGTALAVLLFVSACSDVPTDALSTASEGTPITAGVGSGPVVHVGPPGSDDFATLQSAIDENPGAVLQLQAGTYDIGSHRLTILHGLTLRGATDANGELLTTITAAGPRAVIDVRAVREHADDHITLRSLNIEAPSGKGIIHRAFDVAADEWVFPGGGNLTIDRCEVTAGGDPEAKAYWAIRIEDAAITLKNSKFTSTGDFAVLFDGAAYSSLEIRNNTIRYDNTGILMNALAPNFLDGQDPSKTGALRIEDNDIAGGTRPLQNFVTTGLVVLSPRGPAFVADNVVRIPGAEPTPEFSDVVAVGLQMSNLLGKQVAVTGNQLRGGDSDDGKARIGLLAVGDKGRYAKNVFEDVWSTGVIVALPLLPNPESNLNKFLHNDFTEAQIFEDDTPFPFPSVHWWLGPASSKTSVTDNSGVEQRILDQGTRNRFQGRSFLPMAADRGRRPGS